MEDRYYEFFDVSIYRRSICRHNKYGKFQCIEGRYIETFDVSRYRAYRYIEILNCPIYRNIEFFDIYRTVHISKCRIIRYMSNCPYIEISNSSIYRGIKLSRYRDIEISTFRCIVSNVFCAPSHPPAPSCSFLLNESSVVRFSKSCRVFVAYRYPNTSKNAGQRLFLVQTLLLRFVDCWTDRFCFVFILDC